MTNIPRKQQLRPDLLYRGLNEAGQTFNTDPRLDAIIEKALAFMDQTNPEDWTKAQWTLLNKIWTENKNRRNDSPQKKTSQMSSDDLKNCLDGAPSISME